MNSDLTKKGMIAGQWGLPMFDIETAEDTYVYCSTDLTLESIVQSEGEVVHGMNVLVKVNQPSQNIKDSYKLMMSVDYFAFTDEEEVSNEYQTQWLIGVEPSEVKRSKEFLEKIDKDHWNQDLWDEFFMDVQDPNDPHAVKDINQLAKRFLSESDGLTEDTKALVNGLFITVCGAGLDTLIDRSMEEEQANES